jgi:hypothetical protein
MFAIAAAEGAIFCFSEGEVESGIGCYGGAVNRWPTVNSKEKSIG